MWVFLRIIIFSAIILSGVYFFKPSVFDFSFNKKSDKINIQEYVLTPDPSLLFLEWLRVSASKIYDFNWISSATNLYFQAVNLFQVNIINLLEDSNNKRITLKTYLVQLDNIIDKLDNNISELTSLYTQEETTANMHLQEKQQWDSMFNQWFVEKDSKSIIDWLKTSYKNWPKYMQHRIIANASKIVVWKLQNIRQLLYLKYHLLDNNQNDIVSNFWLIRWDLLPKLLNLKRRLQWNYYY